MLVAAEMETWELLGIFLSCHHDRDQQNRTGPLVIYTALPNSSSYFPPPITFRSIEREREGGGGKERGRKPAFNWFHQVYSLDFLPFSSFSLLTIIKQIPKLGVSYANILCFLCLKILSSCY